MLIGVDEAGKGPVLGSMFVAAVAVPDSTAIPDDVDDSKQLSPEHRRELESQLRQTDSVSIAVVEVTANDIDAANDMDDVVMDAHASAVEQTVSGDDRVILDAAGESEQAFARNVKERVNADVDDFTAEFGADEAHDVVGAASIIAKVARDSQMRELAEEVGRDLGSGYPGDETTRAFLRDTLSVGDALPSFVRESWQTVDDIKSDIQQTGLDEFR